MGPPSYIGCKGNGVTQETAHETAVFLQNKKQIFFLSYWSFQGTVGCWNNDQYCWTCLCMPQSAYSPLFLR